MLNSDNIVISKINLRLDVHGVLPIPHIRWSIEGPGAATVLTDNIPAAVKGDMVA